MHKQEMWVQHNTSCDIYSRLMTYTPENVVATLVVAIFIVYNDNRFTII